MHARIEQVLGDQAEHPLAHHRLTNHRLTNHRLTDHRLRGDVTCESGS